MISKQVFFTTIWYDTTGVVKEKVFRPPLSRRHWETSYYSNGEKCKRQKLITRKSGYFCVVWTDHPYGKHKYWNEQSELTVKERYSIWNHKLKKSKTYNP